jgi:hypothetical protein
LRTVPVVAEKRETAEPALDLQKALEEILAAVRKPSRHASISRSKRQRQVDYLLTFMGGPLGGHRLSSASSSQMERWLADSVVEATKTCKPGEQFALSKKLNEVEVYKYFGGHKYTHDNFMPFFGIREHWPTEDEYDAIYKVGPVAQWGEALHVSVHYVAALWPTGGIETWPVDNQQ